MGFTWPQKWLNSRKTEFRGSSRRATRRDKFANPRFHAEFGAAERPNLTIPLAPGRERPLQKQPRKGRVGLDTVGRVVL